MTKTLALLLDAYRELNAKRMFWVVLIISAAVVGVFGVVGIRNDVITIFNWETPVKFIYLSLISRETFYKLLFVTLGIKFWLSSLATILALVSTAGIFPEFLTGGSIDLYLSKPISRLRLFAMKYIGGLLFVTFQVAVFCAASFLVLGVRGGAWEPAIFLAVPLVVLMFSYLFSACVLLGLLTRSTVAALLLTLVFWSGLWAVHQAETLLLRAQIFDQRRAARVDRQIEMAEDVLNGVTTAPASRPVDPNASWLQRMLASTPNETAAQTRARLEQLQQDRAGITDRFGPAHQIALAIATPLPKTAETIGLLERELISRAELPPVSDDDSSAGDGKQRPAFRGRGRQDAAVGAAVDQELRRRSVGWVVGTSIVFEGLVLAISAWLFNRRDF